MQLSDAIAEVDGLIRELTQRQKAMQSGAVDEVLGGSITPQGRSLMVEKYRRQIEALEMIKQKQNG